MWREKGGNAHRPGLKEGKQERCIDNLNWKERGRDG